jgi:cysteinyl-tRNA synthetase
MGLNWKIVAGKALGTMADRENEYRKFATDYFLKRYETQAEEKRAFDEKIREQKREINKKVDALRAEGLTDTQIANGLNTYKENFFAVVADDLKTFKASKNYENLLSNDKTGSEYRKAYRNRFDSLLVTEKQRALEIEPVVQGLLDKFPEPTETPEIAQSIFGFDYTKGIRDDIKGLSKDTNVPDYDAPAGLIGISDLMSGTIRSVNPEFMYTTSSILDKQIVNRIKKIDKFKNLKTEPASGLFRSEAEQDQADLDVFKDAMKAQNQILQAYSAYKRSSDYKPPSMEGGETDQEILDRITDEVIGSVSAGGNRAEGNGDQTADLDTFSSNVTTYLQNNPGSNSKVSNLIGALQSVNGVNNTVLQKVLSAVASGQGFASALRNQKITLNKSQKTTISKAISDLDSDDKDIIKGLTGGSTQSQFSNGDDEKIIPEGNMARPDPSKIGDSRKFKTQKNLETKKAEAWDKTYGVYLNPDGSLKANVTQDKFDAVLNLLQKQYEEALEN